MYVYLGKNLLLLQILLYLLDVTSKFRTCAVSIISFLQEYFVHVCRYVYDLSVYHIPHTYIPVFHKAYLSFSKKNFCTVPMIYRNWLQVMSEIT
jgi:hypothetical protein